MKKVLLTSFAVLGVASLIIGSTVTKAKFHSKQSIVLTILDTVPKPDSPKSMPSSHYTLDTIPKPDSPVHSWFVAGFQ
jgi:hypothetical protein